MISNARKSTLLSFTVTLLAILVSGCTEAAQPSANGGISVSGQGSIEVEPDMGRVTLHVRREGDDAKLLTESLNQVTADLIALAQQLGIEERDISATALSISPRYRRRGDEGD